MRINATFILIFILLSFTSCIKEFIPNVKKYDELLVVEGAITDKPGPYTVKVSMSGKLQQLSYNPLSECIVEIADNTGNSETLTEVSEGIYKTDSSGIQGVVGRKYKVKISTPEGQLYESQEEVLEKGVGIQSLNAELEHKEKSPDFFWGRDGYQFYVDAENALRDTVYYVWLMESTYKFQVDLLFFGSPALRTCYRTQPIFEIHTFNSAAQSQHQVKRFPLRYEDNYTKALTIRYCLKVDQYTLNEKAYTYWNTLQKMSTGQGSLFPQQPYQVNGNVINISDPKKPALGYFMVAGMDEKRIFVDRPPIGFRYSVCILDTGSPPAPPAPACYDCREEGYLEKPDFWID